MRIAVLCLPGIGDSLMATPFIKVLREAFPEAVIDVICMFEGVAYIYRNNNLVNNVYLLTLYKENTLKGFFSIMQLRKNNYDISFLGYPAYRREYHVVHFLLGAKKRISHNFINGNISEFHFLNTTTVPIDVDEHIVVNNLNLLGALNIHWEKYIKKEEITYFLTLPIKDRQLGNTYIKKLGWDKNQIIAIHPGSVDSAVGLLKRWPKKQFISLSKSLIKKNKHVLFFAGNFERQYVRDIVQNINLPNCKLVANTSFGETLGILQQVSLLVTNDNGFAHLANALLVKEVVLFGPTNPLWCAPYNQKECIILRKAPFQPWFRNDTKVTNLPKFAPSGMENITVDDVLIEIERLLK